MRDIITGVVLIGIGFAFGGSVFLGDFGVSSLIFDGLGIFFIVKGLVKVIKSKQAG
jgi:hypothetical protein